MRRFVSPRLPFRVGHYLLQIVGCGGSGARSRIARQLAIATFGLLTLVVTHSSAPAQLSTKRPVIGVLSPFIDVDSSFLKDLRDGLSDRGLREGRDIAIEYRTAEGRIDQLPVLAEELVRLKVDIIVTAS